MCAATLLVSSSAHELESRESGVKIRDRGCSRFEPSRARVVRRALDVEIEWFFLPEPSCHQGLELVVLEELSPHVEKAEPRGPEQVFQCAGDEKIALKRSYIERARSRGLVVIDERVRTDISSRLHDGGDILSITVSKTHVRNGHEAYALV